mgnify:CR=1 FL=1
MLGATLEADAPLFADFKAKVAKLRVSDVEKQLLITEAADALNAAVKPAYEALIAEMSVQEKVAGSDDGVWRFKDGADYYAERLTNYTTTGMTALRPFSALTMLLAGVAPGLVDGVIAGVGAVLVFLPQILILFAFILALADSGYLPRAAFLLDRVMFASGLTGRSFIPLLSSYACAIPGIMATRSIQDPRDRLATIMVAPLTTCSARLPVYTLLIGAFIPETEVAGLFNLQGLVLFALYLFGIVSVFAVAWVMKMLSLRKSEHALLLELPAYRMPNLRDLLIGLWDRMRIFLRRVGGIILSLTVLLWFLSSFPSPPEGFTEADENYYKRFQISGYALKSAMRPDAQTYSQRVELRIIDVDYQTERTLTDRQSWRYDAKTKRWWLTSGLPKLD